MFMYSFSVVMFIRSTATLEFGLSAVILYYKKVIHFFQIRKKIEKIGLYKK